jgi:hypothetical protein
MWCGIRPRFGTAGVPASSRATTTRSTEEYVVVGATTTERERAVATTDEIATAVAHLVGVNVG